MKAIITPFHLQLIHPFGISGHIRTSTPIVLLKLICKNKIGFGEASLPPYLGVTQDMIINELNRIDWKNFTFDNLQSALTYWHQISSKYLAPAIAAVDIALHDLFGKIENKTICDFYGIEKQNAKPTAFTISLDRLELIPTKIIEAEHFPILKVKLGSPNDKEVINTIRKYTNKPFVVDANQGWNDKESTLDFVCWLKEQGCILVEQPFYKLNLSDSAWLTERSPLPIFADESFQKISDLKDILNCFNGINIKLMKCGGIWSSFNIIQLARKSKLQIFLGSMNESSCAIMAAAALSPLVDFVDLDGPWLISNNPFKTPKLDNGVLVLNDEPGLGIILNGSSI